jgi:hypothetical protein
MPPAESKQQPQSDPEPTKTELQETLRDAGESTSGTKEELEERVEDLSRRHVPDMYVAQVRPKG